MAPTHPPTRLPVRRSHRAVEDVLFVILIVLMLTVAAVLYMDTHREAGDGIANPRFNLTADDVQTAETQLAGLTIAPDSTTLDTYDRTRDFGDAWSDKLPDQAQVAFARNGCDTRNDILNRDLAGANKDGTCTVTTGHLWDPYTGKDIEFHRGKTTSQAVQIDHIVALGDVWVSGGNTLTQQQRFNIANDPINLVAVDGPTNAAKGAKKANDWMPPYEPIHCFYAASQVQVKAKYGLTVTKAEHEALSDAISRCPAGV